MRVLAVIVMVLGLVLMSAPVVLPRLGISLAAPAPEAAPAPPAEGAGTLAAIGNLLARGVGSAAAYLGVASEPAAADPAEASETLAADTGATADSVTAAEDGVPDVSIIETSARRSGGGAKFVKARETAPEVATP